MTDPLTPEQRSRVMSRIRSGWRVNRLERQVHEWLVARRVVHRMNPRRTPGQPDVMVYPRGGERFAIFVDGCFWHACPEHFRPPKNPRPSWGHDLVEEERARAARRSVLPYRWIKIMEHEVRDGSWKAATVEALRGAGERIDLLSSDLPGRVRGVGAPLPGEVWRPVAGHRGYQVSNLGRVQGPRALLSQAENPPLGHRRVAMGRAADEYVHRLVAEAFIGPVGEGLQVRHLNGDVADNAVANLAIGTQAENEADKDRHGRRNPRRKFSMNEVDAVRTAGKGQVATVARSVGMSIGHAYNLRHFRSWRRHG